MRRSRISLGPGAASLILIVVILSMSVLGILALMNARSDSRLSARSVQVVQAGYELAGQAERSLAALDAAAAHCAETAGGEEEYMTALSASLPAGMTLENRTVSWTETDGYRTLECAAELAPMGEAERVRWVNHRLTAITEDAWN